MKNISFRSLLSTDHKSQKYRFYLILLLGIYHSVRCWYHHLSGEFTFEWPEWKLLHSSQILTIVHAKCYKEKALVSVVRCLQVWAPGTESNVELRNLLISQHHVHPQQHKNSDYNTCQRNNWVIFNLVLHLVFFSGCSYPTPSKHIIMSGLFTSYYNW